MQSPKALFSGNGKQVMEEEVNVKEFIDKYFIYHWYLYVIFIGLGCMAAYAYLVYSAPTYIVESSLLIKEDKNESFAPGDKLLKDLNLFGASENVANEIQIINSFSMVNQVVKDLNLAVQFDYQYWIKTIPAYKNFPILLDTFALSNYALNSADYQESSGIDFEIKPIDYQRFELINAGNNLGEYQFEELITNDFGTFRFLVKPPLNFESDSTMHIRFYSPEIITKNYLEQLSVELMDMEATIIQLKLKETIPQRGVDILNHLTEIYNHQTIEDKNKITRNSFNFIEERLEIISKELTVVEGNVEKYKKKNSISSENVNDLNIALQGVSKFTEEQTSLEVQLSILESMGSFLGKPNEFDLIPANLSVANEALTSSIQTYNQLVLKRQKLLETAQPSNPLIVSAEQQLKSFESIIQSTIHNIKRDFRKKLASVKGLNDELTGKLRKAPTQERGLLEIKRQQLVKENLYVFLLQKREEAALSLIATTANSKIIDFPRFERKAVAPKKLLVYIGGLLAGVCFPFMLLIGKDVFQSTILTEEDIKDLTNATIIGGINQTKKNTYIAVERNSRTAIAERFRLIRTNFQFIGKKNRQQTILVTSSISGEGKTFIALNLAMSFALTKQKTILLGMDLRKPKMETYLGRKHGGAGIPEFILGKNKLPEVIRTSVDEPNLDFIPCGKTPFNPQELLLEESVKELFTQLKKIYDVIIIDTPPVGLVSDAILLNDYVSDTLYVVRAGVTEKQMLENANGLFLQKKLKNCSIVFNGVNMKRGYGYKRYGYGGKYGYYEN